MLYWVTETANSSCRLYYEAEHADKFPPQGVRVDVPTGLRDLPARDHQAPAPWAERMFNVTQWTLMPPAATSRRWRSPAVWSTTSARSSALSEASLAEGAVALAVEVHDLADRPARRRPVACRAASRAARPRTACTLHGRPSARRAEERAPQRQRDRARRRAPPRARPAAGSAPTGRSSRTDSLPRPAGRRRGSPRRHATTITGISSKWSACHCTASSMRSILGSFRAASSGRCPP